MAASHQDKHRAPDLDKQGKENYDKIDWSKKRKRDNPKPDGPPKADSRDVEE